LHLTSASVTQLAGETSVRSILEGILGLIKLVFIKWGLFALALCFCSTAYGQTIEVGFDLNTPAWSSEDSGSSHGLDYSKDIGGFIGVLSSHFGPGSNRFHWGLFAGFQSLTVEPNALGYGKQKVTAKSLQLVFEGVAFRIGRTYVAGGMGAGFLSVTELENSEPADTFQLPGLVPSFQATIHGKFGIQLSKRAGLVIGVRSRMADRGKDNTYPFQRGPVVSVGLRINPIFAETR
jgi:hypothetical protein